MRNNKPDMKNIVALTITGDESRFPFLVATITNVLSRVKNLHWYVLIDYSERYSYVENCFYDNVKRDIVIILQEMAKFNNNVLTFDYVVDRMGKSIAWQKATWLEKNKDVIEQQYLLNIDDDIIYETETLEGFIELTNNPDLASFKLFISTQFDVYNKRAHKDYDIFVREFSYEQINSFIKEKGERFIAHHIWESDKLDIARCKAMSSSWCVKIESLFEYNIIEKMKEFEKGERGYDIMMCLELGEALFFVPSMGYHIGLLDEYYNIKWEGHNSKYLERWENG